MMTTLVEVRMNNNGMYPEGIKAVAKGLRSNKNLEVRRQGSPFDAASLWLHSHDVHTHTHTHIARGP